MNMNPQRGYRFFADMVKDGTAACDQWGIKRSFNPCKLPSKVAVEDFQFSVE